MIRIFLVLLWTILGALAAGSCLAEPLLTVVFTANNYGYFSPCPT